MKNWRARWPETGRPSPDLFPGESSRTSLPATEPGCAYLALSMEARWGGTRGVKTTRGSAAAGGHSRGNKVGCAPDGGVVDAEETLWSWAKDPRVKHPGRAVDEHAPSPLACRSAEGPDPKHPSGAAETSEPAGVVGVLGGERAKRRRRWRISLRGAPLLVAGRTHPTGVGPLALEVREVDPRLLGAWLWFSPPHEGSLIQSRP